MAYINNTNNTFNPGRKVEGVLVDGAKCVLVPGHGGVYHASLGNGIFTSNPLGDTYIIIPTYSTTKTTYLALGHMNMAYSQHLPITPTMVKRLGLNITGFRNELANIATNPKYNMGLCLDKPVQIQIMINNKLVLKKFFGKDKFKEAKSFLDTNRLLNSENSSQLDGLDETSRTIGVSECRFIKGNVEGYAKKSIFRLNNHLLTYKEEQDGSITETYKDKNNIH